MKFDPAESGEEGEGLQDRSAAGSGREIHPGGPRVIATSVINDKFIDVAKRLPPPMNAEEEAFSKVMKQVAPAFAALRAGVDRIERRERHQERGRAEAGVHRHRSVLQAEEAGRDAWAAEARKHVEAIQTSVAGGKWDEAKATAGTLSRRAVVPRPVPRAIRRRIVPLQERARGSASVGGLASRVFESAKSIGRLGAVRGIPFPPQPRVVGTRCAC